MRTDSRRTADGQRTYAHGRRTDTVSSSQMYRNNNKITKLHGLRTDPNVRAPSVRCPSAVRALYVRCPSKNWCQIWKNLMNFSKCYALLKKIEKMAYQLEWHKSLYFFYFPLNIPRAYCNLMFSRKKSDKFRGYHIKYSSLKISYFQSKISISKNTGKNVKYRK